MASRNPKTHSELEAFLARVGQTNFAMGNAWIKAAAPWIAYVRRSRRVVVLPELVGCLDLASAAFDDTHCELPAEVVKWTQNVVTRGYALRIWMRWVEHEVEAAARKFGIGVVYAENVLNPSFELIYRHLGYQPVPNMMPLSLYKELA